MNREQKPHTPLRYCLGIDAGCGSIGWAIVELDERNRPIAIHSAGVRRSTRTPASNLLCNKSARPERAFLCIRTCG